MPSHSPITHAEKRNQANDKRNIASSRGLQDDHQDGRTVCPAHPSGLAEIWLFEVCPLMSHGCARISIMARSSIAPLTWSDTLMQLTTFARFEIRLATRGRTIHSLPSVSVRLAFLDRQLTGVKGEFERRPRCLMLTHRVRHRLLRQLDWFSIKSRCRSGSILRRTSLTSRSAAQS